MHKRWISLASGLVTLTTVWLVIGQGRFSWRLKGGSEPLVIERAFQPVLFWGCVLGGLGLALYSFLYRPARRSRSDDESSGGA